jgi:hypothetical protein
MSTFFKRIFSKVRSIPMNQKIPKRELAPFLPVADNPDEARNKGSQLGVSN